MNKLVYKGYVAKIEFDTEEQELVGEIEGIKDLVIFSSKKCDDIEQIFHDSVDGYLASCKLAGKDPDKAYTGSFNIRIDPEEHCQLDRLAKKENTSLNSEVSTAISSYLEYKRKLSLEESIIDVFAKSASANLHGMWNALPKLFLEKDEHMDEPVCEQTYTQKEGNHESDSAKA